MAWGKAGSTTLTSAGTSLDITSYTSSKTDQFLCHDVGTSSNAVLWQFGGSGSVDTGNNYALRYNQQGGTDGTQTSRGNIWAYQSGSDDDRFIIWYGCNVSSQEKLFIGHSVTFNGSGSSVVPDRCESVGKWANTSVQYDTVKAFSTSGNMDIGSNITALGSDLTPAAAVTFPSDVPDYTRFEETDTRKMYSLRPATTLNTSDDFSSSSGWTQVTNTNFGVTGGELIGNSISSGTNGAGVWKDYGLVFDDEKFVFRCKFQIVTQSGQTGNASTVYFGISDTNGATSPSGNRDGFGIAITNYAASGMLWLYPDGTTWDNADTDLSLSPSANTYYLEIKRTSATSVTFTLYSDSTFTTVVKTHTQSIASTLDGLRYVMMQEWRNGSTNTTKIAVDDLKVYNGVSSISAGGWKEKGTT